MNGRIKAILLLLSYVFVVVIAIKLFNVFYSSDVPLSTNTLKLSLEEYHDESIDNLWSKLYGRVQIQPFNLISLVIFLCAILHTFLAHHFLRFSQKIKKHNIQKGLPENSFAVEILHFMSEVEVVFGLWVIPLFLSMVYTYDWNTTIFYLDGVSYLEPMFVVVIMAIASTAPIINVAENGLRLFARIGGGSAAAWWWAILTIGPISGSFITEPGAMTISAFLLAKQFYELQPRPQFAYATLGLLFTNVSVGGVLTSFAAPPVLMVSKNWGWDTTFMFKNFGWKAVFGIILANLIYYVIFRNDFKALNKRQALAASEEKQSQPMPLWITIAHIFFLAWTVIHNHYPPVFIGTFLLFLGFCQATAAYQKQIDLKPSILVGFFLAGLVIHGNLQGWWIEPLLEKTTKESLLVLSAFLTSFNDNAAITFLATLIPNLSDALKYSVVAGAITGGGLTVIANAPNPSGQAILGKYFDKGIAAGPLFLAAIFPTIVIGLIFYLI